MPEVISVLRRAAGAQAAGDDGPAPADPYLDLYGDGAPPEAAGAPAAQAGAGWRDPEPGTVQLGTRADGSPVSCDLTALGGLGLAGPGAVPAARAVLAALLARTPPASHDSQDPLVVIPAADAARLLPAGPAAVPGLSVPASLDAALDEMEARIVALTRAASDPAATATGSTAAGPGPVLIAACPPGQAARLSAVPEAGRPYQAAAVVLGPWAGGTSCQVAADGTAIVGVLGEAAGSPPAPATPPATVPAGAGALAGEGVPGDGIRSMPGPGDAPEMPRGSVTRALLTVPWQAVPRVDGQARVVDEDRLGELG